MSAHARPTLLVGSVNLENAEAVFRAAASILGDTLRSMPDGETGDRIAWIGWQGSVFQNASFLRKSGSASGDAYGGKVREFVRYEAAGDLSQARFDDLGYARAAIESYKTFQDLRKLGVIPAHIRFQVSLPTPIAPLAAAIEPKDFLEVERIYEQAMQKEIAKILEIVPAQDLAIQWDVSVEIGILEGQMMKDGIQPFKNPLRELLARIAKVVDWVPIDSSVGVHLCYGDYGHKHFVEPKDMGLMVQMANGVFQAASRRIDWLHLPVPIDRIDDAYYLPLKDLNEPNETVIYLGLAHRADGVQGGKQRISVAERHLKNFGIATECGLGRRPRETITEVLQLVASLSTA